VNRGDRTPRGRAELDGTRNVLFDLDGCLWFGSRLAPGSAELVAYLRGSGIGVFFLTNASGAGSTELAVRLSRLGLPASPAEVVSPLTVLPRHPLFQRSRRVLTLGKPALADLLRAAGHVPVEEATEAEVVVVGNDIGLRFGDFSGALAALDAGAELLALNLDARVPVEDGGFICGTGAIVAAIRSGSGAVPQVVGKPSPVFFRTALETFGIPADGTVMVGDTPETDVAGGRAAGLKTVLVGRRSSGPRPDLGVPDLPTLLELFKQARGVVAV
jgi:HAD superfamily hydrolase (TIGR01450 family)